MKTFVKSLSAVAVAVALMTASFGHAWAGAGGFGSKIYAAKIRADGTHQAGTGGAGLVSSARIGTGTYEVIFQANRDRCFVTVTLGREDQGAAARGFINVVHRGGNAKGYFITTRGPSNNVADRAFLVLAFCPQ